MRIRGLMVATLVFCALAGVLYWSDHRKPSAEAAKSAADTPPAILKLDQSGITKLEIRKKDAEPVLLAKAQSGDWQITAPKSFAADQTTVSGMLSMLSSVNSERVVEEKAADLKTYGLDPPALEVDVTEKDNQTQKLLVGDDTPTGGAVYAMLAGNPRVYTMSSFGKTGVDKSLNDLRDKRLLTVAADKISRIELVQKNQDIEFGRSKDEWQILKPRPLRADSSQVDDVVRKLTDARMDLSGSDAGEAASAFAHAAPVVTAKVTDQAGTQELQIRKNKDTYYAKSSIVEGAYKVSSDLAAALEKSVDDFRNKKLFDFGFNDPNKVELHNGAKSYFLTRSGENWWSNGKKMDEDSVQSLVSKLRDLAAGKFVDSGFTTPAIDASASSDDGKKVERILIAKVSGGYVAKRDGEPTLYKLDSTAVDDLLKAAEELKPAATPAKK